MVPTSIPPTRITSPPTAKTCPARRPAHPSSQVPPPSAIPCRMYSTAAWSTTPPMAFAASRAATPVRDSRAPARSVPISPSAPRSRASTCDWTGMHRATIGASACSSATCSTSAMSPASTTRQIHSAWPTRASRRRACGVSNCAPSSDTRRAIRQTAACSPSDGELPPHECLARALTRVIQMTDSAIDLSQRLQPMPDWATRAHRLRALEKMLLEQREAFAAAINADFGCRPREETDLLEIYPSLSAIRHTLSKGRRWMKPRRRLADLLFLPARIEMRPQPRGVVGIIVPWNYPLYLAGGPLVDALGAGNRAMLKMSEFTPRFSALFAEQVARHFKPDEVTVVTGDA